jgi:GT2 family glycosyltransferase
MQKAKMKKSRTCVILVNYAGAEDTANCLRSLLAGDIIPQLVVVDNTPDDPELSPMVAGYPDAELIRAPENLGFGRGNNLGIVWALKNTECEFIFILNNDAMVKPDAIRQMEAAMDHHPEAGIVTARIVLAEDESKLWYGGGEVDWRRGGGRVPGVLGPADAPLAVQARHVTFASGCAMMVRSEILRQHEGFDSRFFMYEEDLELSLRVQECGVKIWYEPNALVSHIGQGSQKGNEKFYSRYDPKNTNLVFLVYQGVKNSLLNMDMHARSMNRAQFFLVFPVILLIRCCKWIIHGRYDAVISAFKAIKDYFKER